MTEWTDDDIAGAISALPGRDGGLHADALRALHARRRRLRRAAGPAVLLAAAVLITPLVMQSDVVRAKGFLGAAPQLELVAVAEGPDGRRALTDGSTVAPDERVVFAVRSNAEGTVTLTERGPGGDGVVWPTSGSWSVESGEAWIGGSAPLSWRPDQAGRHAYEAEWCAGDRCIDATIALDWK